MLLLTIGIELKSCDDLEDVENYVPTYSWRDALKAIVCRNIDKVGEPILNIIVAHRETIRKLAEKKVPTPYCSIALFQPYLVEGNLTVNKRMATTTQLTLPKLPSVITAMKVPVAAMEPPLSKHTHTPSDNMLELRVNGE